MHLHIFVYNQMWKLPYSVMRTGFPVPTIPELYKIHSIMRTLVCHICKIVRHLQWIQRQGIILALSLIMLAFVNIVQQWRDLKTRFVLNSRSTHYHAYRKYPGSPRNKGISILLTHSGGHNNVHFRGVPLYMLMWFL